jgi:hypothetical protein
MADATVKTAVVFQPKRQWKPKRRDRDISRRKKRKRWWRRNRQRLKIKRGQRRRQLKNNSLFKHWRKKRQREKQKRRMRFATEGNLPEVWFIFRDEAVPLDIDLGYIVDYDPDTEELLVYDVDDDQEKTVDLDEFLSHSEFLEEADLDNFELLMDQYYGGPEDDLDIVEEDEQSSDYEAPIEVDAIIERVARRYILKCGFNKENPSDLLSQLVKVLDKAERRAPSTGRRRLKDVSSRVKGLSKDVQQAWNHRDEE